MTNWVEWLGQLATMYELNPNDPVRPNPAELRKLGSYVYQLEHELRGLRAGKFADLRADLASSVVSFLCKWEADGDTNDPK